jgi:tetraprenyl-beta-curcumene synthase
MSHRNPAPLTVRQTFAIARSAVRELCCGLLAVKAELRRWNARARRIPDPAVRALVVQGMTEGRALADGAALFWTLPGCRSLELLRTLVAFQTLLNILDVLMEAEAQRLGQPRHWSWLIGYALDADSPPFPSDIINNELGDDDGFINALVTACQEGCRGLSSYTAARDVLLREARRAVSFEIEHEPDRRHRCAKIERWAGAQFGDQAALAPWELAGGASSLLTAMAVLGVAADPGVGAARMRRVADAYVWTATASALLDSYVDLEADQSDGSHNWFGYYDSVHHGARRTGMLLSGALERVRALPAGERHAVIVGAMAALALSDDAARRTARRAGTAMLIRSGGTLTRVLVPVLRAWRTAYRRRAG